MVSSRSGEVESSATGAAINSSMRRTYLTADAGSSAQERAPRVLSDHPSRVSKTGSTAAWAEAEAGTRPIFSPCRR